MQQFERAELEVQEYIEDEHYGKFEFGPLERGFGTTIGNAIRRVLLAAMPGGAVYSIKIDGIYHEFTAIPGIVEDVTAIILNLKNMVLKIEDEEDYTLRLNVTGPATVTAGDIVCPTYVTVLNPDLVICHISEGGKLEMEMKARKGRGYLSAEENKALYQSSSQGIGTIYTDSIFTPVTKATYEVNPTRVNQSAKYDNLTLEVWTNGSIHPQEAVALASKILTDHLVLLTEINPCVLELGDSIKETSTVEVPDETDRNIEELELNNRAVNCLKRANIHTVNQLCSKSEDYISKLKNCGKKTVEEIKDALHRVGRELNKSEI
jgi:DNA-directed RNA polymerase subunit alpha